MSHEGTTWAILQRGLKPATKLVLWHLCDRHNPDYGCFPSQDRLAHDAEVSRATLNRHLDVLEDAGLIRRIQRIHPVTRRQLSTRYLLGFKEGFTTISTKSCPEMRHGPEAAPQTGDVVEETETTPFDGASPCLKLGHGISGKAVSHFSTKPCLNFDESRVSKRDTNLVSEPLREPTRAGARDHVPEAGNMVPAPVQVETGDAALIEALLTAVGVSADNPQRWWQSPHPQRHIQRWREEFGLSDAEILETARRHRGNFATPPEGPKALDRAMGRASKDATLSQGSDPEAGLAMLADWINGIAVLPTSAITNAAALKLLSLGLVTPERMRERTGWAFAPERVRDHG